MIDTDQIKKIVAQKAVELIHSGMKVGLGSGSTAAEFIKALSVKVENGLKIEAIAASNESEKLAASCGIPINPHLSFCDIYIDGADEIDSHKNCLKGKGKALFREKIIATMSRQVVILIDETKQSQVLHKAPLVCELLPFGYEATLEHIHKLGLKGKMRTTSANELVVTDNGAYLYDIYLKTPISDPSTLHNSLKHIPGVLETGLFFNIVNKIIVGLKGGQIIVYE